MKTLNICRPGYGASCALCCGSHNYDAPLEEIDHLYRKRAEVLKNYSRDYIVRRMRGSRSDLTGSYYFARDAVEEYIITLPRLYDDGLQCPFVAYIGDGNILGCALYPREEKEDYRYDCFQNYTCKYFSCPASDVLTDAEILFAAKLFRDWYYYTLLIHSVDILKKLAHEYSNPENIPSGEIKKLREILLSSLKSEKELHALSSYFS